MRLIKTLKNGTHTVQVRYNSEYKEYRVQLSKDGQRIKSSDYYTDNKDDAIFTAEVILGTTITD